MNVSVKKFKQFVGAFNKLKSHIYYGKIQIQPSYNNIDYNDPNFEDKSHKLSFNSLVFKNLKGAYEFCKHSYITGGSISIKGGGQFLNPVKEALAEYGKKGTACKLTIANAAEMVKAHKSLRLVPKTIPENAPMPKIIHRAPIEVMEGNNTYRIITSFNSGGGYHSAKVELIARDDDKLFDYLDRGFFYMVTDEINVNTGKSTRYIAVTNELDVHTMSILTMTRLQPKLTENLKNGHFVHSSEAQLVRLKLEKKLSPKVRAKYDEYRAYIEQDYQSNTSMLVLNGVMKGEIEKTAVNQITLTKNRAQYENISIEADDLLEVLYGNLNFSGEYDIYTMVQIYTEAVQKRVDELKPAEGEDSAALPKFKINDIELEVTCNKHMSRKINGVRINMNEIQEALYRASCHRAAEEYQLFLRRISKMSLRWHDVIANGLPVKIQDRISHEEYSEPKPSSDAPPLKFYIDAEEKCIKLRVSDTRGVRVKLGKIIQRVDSINKKTNGRWSYNAGRSRDNIWARNELVGALKDACTFTKKVKAEDGTVTEETETLITKEDVLEIIKVVNELKLKAIKRSKEFLATAVKVTKAEEIEFLGKKAYKVKGGLREYAVIVETAKVYDFETKQYRCIVNDQHFRGAGYDDVAARLYVLKNDSVMQNKIRTLQGAAQPQYENHHDRDLPDRGEAGIDIAVLDKLELV